MLSNKIKKNTKQIKNLNPNLIRVLFVIGFYILVHDTYNNLALLGITLIIMSIIWLIIDYLFVLDEINKYISLIPAGFDVLLNMLFVYITGAGNSMTIVFAISAIAMSTILADHRGFYQSLFIITTSIILYTLMILALSYSLIPYINLLDFSITGFHFHSILSIIIYIIFAFGIFYGMRNIRIAQLNSEKEINRYAMSVEQAYSELQIKQSELQENKEVTDHTLKKANHLNEMIQVIIQSNSVDDIFKRIYDLFSERYKLNTYLVYILDKEDGLIKLYKTYGDDFVDKDYLTLLYKNHFLISDKYCVHGNCLTNKRSFLLRNVRLPHKYKPEEENIVKGEIKSFYIIPLINENEPFGTITFSDNKFQRSNIPNLTKSDREEIENFIKLISPSIFQSLQKQEIERAKEITERTLQKTNQLNEMIEVIIKSKTTDEIFENIYKLFFYKYDLSSYLVYVVDHEMNRIFLYKYYGSMILEPSYFKVLQENSFSLNDDNSVHVFSVKKKRSILFKSIQPPHPCIPEEDNIIKGEIDSIFIIPLIIDEKAFGTISFSNSKYEKADLKNLNRKKREEIETFVKLISPFIHQSFQKQLIEKAYSDLHLIKTELESRKSQMERLQSMSQEIQKKTDIHDMLLTLEDILWESYKIGNYFLVVKNTNTNELYAFSVCQNWKEFSLKEKLKNVPLNDEKSIHKIVFEKKRSLFLPKLKNISNGEEEDYNRKLLGMEALFAIPCIVNNESFAILSLTEVNPRYTKDPKYLGVKRTTPKQRDEIEQLVALIANPLYQSLQKQKIEAAYQELQETQSQLIEAERMASLGQLVGGIAHEINNPIAVIHSHAELLDHNNHITLRKVPLFLETLTLPEKTIFYGIVDQSVKNRIFLNSKEERKQRKDTEKLLQQIVEDEDLRTTLSESLLHLRLPPPYETYIQELGAERFSKFLSMAEVFKNQSNSLSSIEIAVEKASRVIFALRSYLNTELSSSRKEVDLVKELEKALHVYDNYVMGKINIRQDFPRELRYTCVAENIAQVWKNLFFNAIQAMYDTDKKLELRLEQGEKLPESLKSYKTSSIVEDSLFQKDSGKSWILVSITDSGTGIPLELQNKVFTPFFTTKSIGEGIGLGLYTCKKIVHEHGGALFFKSGEGSTEFVVVLPS